MIEQLLLLVISALGVVIMFSVKLILGQLAEIKQEIQILQNMEHRIERLEEFREHFKDCANFAKSK